MIEEVSFSERIGVLEFLISCKKGSKVFSIIDITKGEYKVKSITTSQFTINNVDDLKNILKVWYYTWLATL